MEPVKHVRTMPQILGHIFDVTIEEIKKNALSKNKLIFSVHPASAPLDRGIYFGLTIARDLGYLFF
jgi:hypothetical protein